MQEKDLKNLRSQELITAQRWNQRYRSGLIYTHSKPLIFVQEFFGKFGMEFQGKSVLDIGCGPGRNLIYVAQLGFEVFGIDISQESIIQLRKRLNTVTLRADIRQGSFYNLPYSDGFFSCVMVTNVLHHNDWLGVKRSFREIQRVLKTNGFFVFIVRTTKNSPPAEAKVIRDKGITYLPTKGTKRGIKIHHFSQLEIEELARTNSLDILELKESVHSVPARERSYWNVICKKR